MDMVKSILGTVLQDKSVWTSAALWLLTGLNAWLKLGLNHDTLLTLSSAVSTFAATHLAHSNTVGAPDTKEAK